MKFVLNVQKGTTVNHPCVEPMHGGVAYEITDEVAKQLKHIYNLVIFDAVVMKKD